MIPEFSHIAPSGYKYEFEQFTLGVIAVWLIGSQSFSTGKQSRTIWGFYKSKTKEYFAPINSKKVGAKVRFNDTRNYTAMQIKQTVLEQAFV